ncbi:hypothetical protein B4096_0873 [Heyndrickxia coagulans]|uniref:Uncharacterized protein n=1 Tax=Heyndrickxia coagulans TaxID=1398 RepID=A0A0C5CC60_HEYCO|nr:hypothetical protein SB48_HM08orf05761 [Heyndrickxia coagulans]KWZ85985.1 hypothetical protein HMPREF3213_00227 [Heyndrickxia coagulans]KYC62701.1 hypothetical protein B4100_0912 [Heyndrickxia coagulans]KYC80651.1 hypothetical protein B4096_0873 [Heyndrickxia coagulans]
MDKPAVFAIPAVPVSINTDSSTIQLSNHEAGIRWTSKSNCDNAMLSMIRS